MIQLVVLVLIGLFSEATLRSLRYREQILLVHCLGMLMQHSSKPVSKQVMASLWK